MKSRKVWIAAAWAVAGLGFAPAPASAQRDDVGLHTGAGLAVPAPPREFRALWVASVFNIDWPSSRTRTPTQQRNEAIALLDAAVAARINAVFLQIRPQCDALYPSTLEPWSPYLTNVMGTAPSPLYDPLQFWIDEARKRNIEVHAWLNPYRALVDKNATASSGHIKFRKPQIVVEYDKYLWLNPGHPDTPAHVRQVILDVVNRYDLDGVVFDDYFYPYPVTGVAFPDSAEYALYGGGLSLGDWRRKNVDDFVRNVYADIRAAKPHVKFGIGPFGIWRPGHPSGITGLDSYASLYADSRKWLQLGWVDYLSPQLYWRTTSTAQNYGRLLEWWVDPAQNPLRRHVWPSNFTSQIADGTWPVSEIQAQIDETRATPGAGGNVHFSARMFTNNTQSLRTTLAANQYAQPALVPATPWLDNVPPLSPSITYNLDRATSTHQIGWTNPGGEAIRSYVLATLIGSEWRHQILASTATSTTVPLKNSGQALRAFALASVDRMGNLSPWTARVLDPTAVASTRMRDARGGISDGPRVRP